MARPINKELQFSADAFLRKVQALFPDAEIVEIKDNGKTVFKSSGPRIAADDLRNAIDFDNEDEDFYKAYWRDRTDNDDNNRLASMYGYFDAVVLIYRNKIATQQEYERVVLDGELSDLPIRPDTFYHNCWRRFGGWEGFLWHPGKADPEEAYTDNPDDMPIVADLESVTQANWTYRTSTINGYRASIAAGAVRGAPHSPEKAWPGIKLEKLLWPRKES
jgi:hypothetical protein